MSIRNYVFSQIIQKKLTSLLYDFQVGRKDVLKHPVAETFLFLKWRRIRKFFVLSFIYHALFISLYSLYILRKYYTIQ